MASPDQVTELYRSYEAAKRRKRVVDFDDILRMVVHTLETQPDRARVLRWRFRHFFVDEFQDVNPLQFRLLEAWLGDRDDLCVVGDPHQAIYRWNGEEMSDVGTFFELFAEEKRRLGTPSLPRAWFENLREEFGKAVVLHVVRDPDGHLVEIQRFDEPL